ncbi:MAG: translation initiation factor, partial [Opitutales bacterium]|nr:translation initiation factor [Opitutales bacterium]
PVKLGKVHLRIEKSGRSGKTVTILEGPGIAALPAEQRSGLLKSLKQKFACGGAEVDGKLELQGDDRDRVRFFLQLLGYTA